MTRGFLAAHGVRSRGDPSRYSYQLVLVGTGAWSWPLGPWPWPSGPWQCGLLGGLGAELLLGPCAPLGADAGAHITASTGRRATTLREASHVQLALRPAALLQLLLVLRR